jgi:PAS domain S-box-containing protein
MNQTKHGAKPNPAVTLRSQVINFLHSTTPGNLWLVIGLLLFGLAFTMFASLYVKADLEAASQREFDLICNEIELHIANRLNTSAQLLHGDAGLFDATETVTRDEWRAYTQQLQIKERLPGIQGIGFSLLIPPDQLDNHIQEIRAEGFPGYTVKPAGERDVYSAIIFLEPFLDRNLRAFGYDMFSEPIRRAAMEQARDENSAVLSGKVILVQETSQYVQAGTLMYLPVYHHGMPLATVEQRRAAILGWVYSPYRMTDMINGTLDVSDAKQKERQIALQVYDGDVISAESLLYDSRSAADKALVSTGSVSKLTAVNFAGRRWTLLFSQPGGLASTVNYSSAWLVFLGGTSISLLLFGLAISLLTTRVNARRMAQQLTAELRESEEKYRVVFNNEIYSICIFDIETLNLLDVNEAFTHLYGYSRDELLSGMTIHDITAEHQASQASTAQAIREGTTFIPLRYHRKKDGTVLPVEIVGGPYEWQGRKVMFGLIHDISERKLAEERVKEQAYFPMLNPGPTLRVDAAGVVQLANPVAIDIGLVAGASLTSIFPELRSFDLDNCIRTGETYIFESPIKDRVFMFTVRGVPGMDNAFIYGSDISARKQAELLLRQNEEKYRTVADFTYDWEAWRAPDGSYLYVSPSCERISGHAAAEFLADPDLLLKITHPDDLEMVNEHYDSTSIEAEDQDLEFDFRIITTAGKICWIGHTCTAVYSENGQWMGRRESNRDVSVRKKAEQALQDSHNLLEQRVQERTAELKTANRDLEKAGRMKDEFLANMSHELRTPLTGILGLSEIMQMPGQDPLTEKQSTYLGHIHKNGQRLQVIINDMVDFSMIEAGKVILNLVPCSLQEICKSSLEQIKTQAAAKGLQSSLSIIPENIILTADARRLQKILVNLLGNAVKFTPNDGSFGIEARGDQTTGQVQITIWDNGIGIKEEDLPLLFQPFIQLDARLSRQYEGTGLGLAMVRRLTELHGGSVAVQSVPGQGSRFTVTLPWST